MESGRWIKEIWRMGARDERRRPEMNSV